MAHNVQVHTVTTWDIGNGTTLGSPSRKLWDCPGVDGSAPHYPPAPSLPPSLPRYHGKRTIVFNRLHALQTCLPAKGPPTGTVVHGSLSNLIF
jgi:hypothetical protein